MQKKTLKEIVNEIFKRQRQKLGMFQNGTYHFYY